MQLTLRELVRLLEATPLSKEEIIAVAKTFPPNSCVAVDDRYGGRGQLVIGVAMAMPGGAVGSALAEYKFRFREPDPRINWGSLWVDNYD